MLLFPPAGQLCYTFGFNPVQVRHCEMQIRLQDRLKILTSDPSGSVTYFAPAERASAEELEKSVKELAAEPLLEALLDTFGAKLLILNRQRQIVVASQELAGEFEFPQAESMVGLRPGEALNCVHAWDNPAGCGTGEVCSTCGAVTAILKSQETGLPVEQECLLSVRRGELEEAREIRLRASPLNIGGNTYTLISLTDISQEKRRETLEKVFFHDILNTIAGLHGWTRVLNQLDSEKREAAAKRIRFLTERLYREIEDQRALLLAERGTLQIHPAPVLPQSILESLEGVFAGHEVARGKTLEVIRNSDGQLIQTDDSMVVRVLTNMVKNALEETPAGGTVRVWTRCESEHCEFLVWNAGVIPKNIALQIFRRSFSTKAQKGRGIGTFSMKLFGERYLRGKVRFVTSKEGGTTFSLSLPRQIT